jgi:predicted nucleotidyltransferase
VGLVGSLARGEFRQGSDIDLAAEGVPPERFFEIAAAIDRMAEPFHADLVPLECATPAFLAQLAADGIELTEDPDVR